MAISAISPNILPGLNDDLIQSPEGKVYPVDVEKSKIPAESVSKSQFQDTLTLSKDARSEKEKTAVEELKKVDQEVQQHEAAHQAAAGELFRGKSFTYKIGPDGQRYAVAGDVQVDTSPIQGNPRATIAKMQKIRRAALAPVDPSSQDVRVAEAAAKTEMEAQKELSQIALKPFIQHPKIDVSLSPNGKKDSSDKTNTESAAQTNTKEDKSLQSSVSLNASMHISTLFGSEKLSSPEGNHIDISL